MESGSVQYILKHTFGYDRFRSFQQQVIEHVVAGGDALVLMPTGGGKSPCYQIPALLRPGVGIVVSPLIALMQNQVAALEEVGVRAALLNSTLSSADAAAVERRLRAGELPVARAIITDFRAVSPDDPLQHAVELVLRGSQQDFPVVEGGRVSGVLTRTDLLAALAKHAEDEPVASVMRREFQAADAD